jgi:hypothetical protein
MQEPAPRVCDRNSSGKEMELAFADILKKIRMDSASSIKIDPDAFELFI